MEFTNGMIEKARQAASAEELRTMAKEEGVALTAEEAEQYFTFLHAGGALPDEALEAIAGGKGKKTPDPKFKVGQHVWIGFPTTRSYVHYEVRQPEFYTPGQGWRYLIRELSSGYDDAFYNEYLETRRYVFTYEPKKWID